MTSLRRKIDDARAEIGKTNTPTRIVALKKKVAKYEDDMAKAAFVVVIFSVTAAEAYIYDYAARRLGDSYVKDHLDKLDTVSKWVVIPALITGKELPRSENWHGMLKKLTAARNSIIHHKSSNPPLAPSAEFLDRLHKQTSGIYDTAAQSIRLLNTLADKISASDPEETPWVQLYLK